MTPNLKVLSFSSPKGGVGRTLTLTNCAKLYSNGVSWAGIVPSVVLLADLDFYAPGIHYYDFFNHDGTKGCEIEGKAMTFKGLLNHLDTHEAGLLFYLSSIIVDPGYHNICRRAIREFERDENNPEILLRYQNETMKFLSESNFNPMKHVVQIPSKSVYVLPAASPNHKNYGKGIFDFNWNYFVNNCLGLDLLDCILSYICNQLSKHGKPIRVLLDQQGGSSIASAINKNLASSHIFISGFNEQSKSGLKALITSHQSDFADTEPWIVLNQYNYRKIALNYNAKDEFSRSPHQVFRSTDQEKRREYIASLKIDLERVFVTEFANDAIQSEHFYKENNISILELTQLLVGIEKEFAKSLKLEEPLPTTEKCIVYLGEAVIFDTKLAGPHVALYDLLREFFPKAKIIALSANHSTITSLSNNRPTTVTITNIATSEQTSSSNLRDLEGGFYILEESNSSTQFFNIEELDFLCYPYHLQRNLINGGLIRSIERDDFFVGLQLKESLISLSFDYCSCNVFQWDKYCVLENNIIGIPLFFDFQLLAYHKNISTRKSKFPELFKKENNRIFEGFRNPQDLIDFAKLATKGGGGIKRFEMFSQPDIFEMWYEWLTIFSIFYYGDSMPSKISQLPDLSDITIFRTFLLEEKSIDAMLMYLNLFRLSSQLDHRRPDSREDWNKVVQNFYDSIDNSLKSLMLIWPDTIPFQHRMDSDYIYQVPPSFKIFEEGWLLSMTNSNNDNSVEMANKVMFLNYYLSCEGQNFYLDKGGIPINRMVMASLESWQKYPFIPPLGSIYLDSFASTDLIKSWQDISHVTEKFYILLQDLRRDCHDRVSLQNKIYNWS